MVVRSAAWSAIQIGGNQVTSFIVFMILTRILKPSDLGLVALALSFIDLAGPLMRGGLPEALIQRKETTEEQADTCFWGTLTMSFVLGGALVAGAGGFARLFGAPALAPVLRVLALLLPISALTAVHEARITRAFGYRALAVRGLASNLIGGVVGVVMARMGYGLWSLVAQRIVAALASVVIIWASFPWRPRLKFSVPDFKSMIRFGVHMVITNFLSTLNGRIADFVLGYCLGTAAVGHVRVASRCLEMVTQFTMNPLMSVALPALSRLQSDRPAFERAVTRMVQVCGLMTFPAYIGLALVSRQIVPLVFGAQWTVSASLLPIMCFSVVPITLQYVAWPALASVGRSDRAALGVFIVVASSALATALAAPFGVRAAVTANVARSYLTLPIILAICQRHTGVRWNVLVSAIGLPLAGSAVMAMVVYAVGKLGLTLPVHWKLALMIGSGLVTYGAFLFFYGRRTIGEISGMRLKAAV